MWVYLCTQQPSCISCPQLEIIKGTPTYDKDFLIERSMYIVGYKGRKNKELYGYEQLSF